MNVRRAAAAVACLVLLVACSDIEISSGSGGGASETAAPIPTDVEGNTIYEDSRVTGVITGADGADRPDVAVDVIATDTGSNIEGFFAVVFTLGLACIPDGCVPGSSSIGQMITGPDGAYDFVLPEGYLAGYETDTDWIVTATLPAAEGQRLGPVSSFEFEANAAVQQAPPLPLWEQAPAVTGDGVLLSVAVAPTPALATDDVERSVRFHDDQGSTLWELGGARTVDARVLEDLSLSLTGFVYADVRVPHGETRTIYHQRIATPTVSYAGSMVPMSRGALCTTEPAATVGCTATDGNLVHRPDERDDEAPTSTTVDLASPREIGLVVARGCYRCLVEASADGTTWRVLPSTDLDGPSGVSAGTSDPITARYVRVRAGEDQASAAAVAEISVWPPAPATPSATPEAGLLDDDDLDDGGRSWGEGLAVAAAILAVAGLAYGAFRVQRQLRT